MRFSDRITSGIGGCAIFGVFAVLCFDGCSNSQNGGANGAGGASGASRGGSGGSAGGGGNSGVGGSVGGSGGAGGSGGKGGSATGGTTSTGGSVGAGGSGGSSGGNGGSSVGGSGGAGGSGGKGGSVTGGTTGTGGSAGGSGGNGGSSAGGSGGSGGSIGKGGASATGGAPSTGGSAGRGGSSGTGGAAGTGGGSGGAGGSSGTGGSPGTGGSTPGTGGIGGQGGGTASDGCTSELANHLTLSQVAIYQTVKIPVMKNGSEVAASARNSHVVQAHDTLFRMFVTLDSGWTARDLSARLTLTPAGGPSTLYSSKKTISAASTDASQTNTFQIYVPASAMAASMRYSVQIVECGSQSGSPGAASFPTTGDIDLGVKSPGGVKITIIPLKVGSYLPDTSETALAGYASQMVAMYPANAVTFTVGTTLTAAVDAAGDVDWEGMLNQIQDRRATDKPANDVYYFGLVKPADTFVNYCRSTCVTGIGYVVDGITGSYNASARAAVGIGYADKESYLTMAHEVGHNHGREHAPCETSDADPSYPYAGGLIGSWGYDARSKTLLDPAKNSDIMGYCSSQWISDYTYSALTTRVAGVNGAALHVYTAPETLSSWRILRVSSRKGARWGAPVANEAPAGKPELATVQDASGNSIATVTVYRTRIADLDGAMLMVPEPQVGWYAVTVAGAPSIPFAPATK